MGNVALSSVLTIFNMVIIISVVKEVRLKSRTAMNMMKFMQQSADVKEMDGDGFRETFDDSTGMLMTTNPLRRGIVSDARTAEVSAGDDLAPNERHTQAGPGDGKETTREDATLEDVHTFGDDDNTAVHVGNDVIRRLLSICTRTDVDAWAHEWVRNGMRIPKGLKRAATTLNISTIEVEEWLSRSAAAGAQNGAPTAKSDVPIAVRILDPSSSAVSMSVAGGTGEIQSDLI
jgi:hypothetical protein